MMASIYITDSAEIAMRGSLGGSKFDTINNGVDVNHLSIFLALHVDDTPPPVLSSPRSNYDTIWPSSTLIDRDDSINLNMSPAGIISPSHKNNSNRNLLSPSRHPPTASPSHSPRSPKASNMSMNLNHSSSSVSSPISPNKRVVTTITTTPQTRSAAQHLFSLKQKLPFLLKVISTDELMSSTGTSIESSPLHESAYSNSQDDPDKIYSEEKSNHMTSTLATVANLTGLEFMISKAALDSLSLVISGGWSKADNIKRLSLLHPYWYYARKEFKEYNTIGSTIGGGSINASNITTRNASGKLFENKRPSTAGTLGSSSSNNTPSGKFYDSKPTSPLLERKEDMIGSAADSLCFSELSQWLEDNLTINDHIFPLSSSSMTYPYNVLVNTPSYISLGNIGPVANLDFKNTGLFSPRPGSSSNNSSNNTSPRGMSSFTAALAEETMNSPPNSHNIPQSPFRLLTPLHDLKINAPTVIKNCASTIIYIVNSGYESSSSPDTMNNTANIALSISTTNANTAANTANSRSHKRNMSQEAVIDDEIESINLNDGKDELLQAQPSSMSAETDSNDGSLSARSNRSSRAGDITIDQLPHAIISGCTGAHIYLLAPYTSATISHCSDCEIILGAVAGTLVMNYCERVTVTAACRKLLIVGSSDCRICIATLTTSVIIGDCRGIVFGKYKS